MGSVLFGYGLLATDQVVVISASGLFGRYARNTKEALKEKMGAGGVCVCSSMKRMHGREWISIGSADAVVGHVD